MPDKSQSQKKLFLFFFDGKTLPLNIINLKKAHEVTVMNPKLDTYFLRRSCMERFVSYD